VKHCTLLRWRWRQLLKETAKLSRSGEGRNFQMRQTRWSLSRVGGDGENFKYPYPNEKPNEILILNVIMRWSHSDKH